MVKSFSLLVTLTLLVDPKPTNGQPSCAKEVVQYPIGSTNNSIDTCNAGFKCYPSNNLTFVGHGVPKNITGRSPSFEKRMTFEQCRERFIMWRRENGTDWNGFLWDYRSCSEYVNLLYGKCKTIGCHYPIVIDS